MKTPTRFVLDDEVLATTTGESRTDDANTPLFATRQVTKLFQERLQAWKHACGYLEEYITATEKLQLNQAKEYEKVLKTVSNPLREAHHFDQNLGGMAGMFDNIRSNTQGISNSHNETAKALKGQVLPSFERLHAEIKNKNKELTKGAGKQGKVVDKARAVTQKHIELLGQHAAAFDSQGGRMTASEDPYVLQRQVMHRLNKQVIEENNNRQDLLAVQGNFSQFEAHVIQTMQQGLEAMAKILTGQQEQTKAMYNDIVGTAACIPLDYEWQGFIQRNTHILIDPNAPPRAVSNISFPNQGHRATQPLIAGSLERRGKMLRSYNTAFYVVSPAKFLHEFKTDDDFAKDPEPDISLYLPDCVIGAIDGNKFNVKGKDVSKGKVGNAFSMTHEFAFKAHTPSDAEKWYNTLRSCIGTATNDSPISPAGSRAASTTLSASPTTPGDEKAPSPLQTQGITGGETTESPAVASAPTSEPASAVEKKA
ncbi:putative PH domain-containing protein [Diplodia seriata]|uniref:Putative PH domain-containing protein n=1 Tax=Diplodia seriata TaxID=420778 RepID=A0A1S8BLZ2_9PEZI|nr:putative PH domain-containing protein [Diplodia seriata]